MTPRPPTPTLFPYTTLFRSLRLPSHRGRRRRFHNSRGVYSPMNDSGETALRPDYRPTVGLVLTGGGARSAYQVGVLRALAELLPRARNPFQIIVGTSAGAVAAGV